uniref:hypothetical protein n=1 Tax=Gemmiger formicilis TaxID=745368 RepID=UPI004038B290
MKFYAPCIGKRRAGGVVCAEKGYAWMPYLAMCTKYKRETLLNPTKPKTVCAKKSAFRANDAPPHDTCGMVGLQKKRRISGRAARPTKEENTCLKSHA